jgi:NTP pyrophosphatase (non-canonical NTP hydrolase)
MSTDLQDVKEQIKAFVKEREWEQFHNAKDLALALSIEAAELNECFLWKSHNEAKVDKVKDELADILIYAILFADKYGFDIPEIIAEKIEKNAAKYPTDKAKGNAKNTQTYSSRPRAITLRGIFLCFGNKSFQIILQSRITCIDVTTFDSSRHHNLV